MAKRKETEFDKLARLIKSEGEDIRKEMHEGFAAAASDTKELRQEVIDQFDHVDTQFKGIKTDIPDIYAEVANIHRQLDRLEERGASSAGFSKEIDVILSRVAFIEKHLGIKHPVSK
jgi:archaellum component FlaC